MHTAYPPMIAKTGNLGYARLALLWASTLFCVALLGGCSDKGDKPSSQVAAKVNDTEITIHQVNSQLARSGVTGDAAAKEASKRILESLIDQQLLLQEATRKKLDRDPVVMQSIEDAKRQILANAYLERMVYNRKPPTPSENRAFYDSHPELFAKRKAYKFRTFAIAKNKFDDSVKPALDTAKTASDVSSILKSRGIEFKEDGIQWLSEQAPMEMLPTLVKMKIGDIVSLDQGEQATIMLLEGTVDSPVNEAQAQPVIEKYILNLKNKELLDAKIKQLRAGEIITYVGQFAEQSPTAPEPKPETKQEGQPGTLEPAPNTKQPEVQQPSDHIKKGLEGLK